MKSILIGILFLSYTGCDRAINSDRELVSDDLQAVISEFENELRTDLTRDSINGSISAAIVGGDRVIWSKAFG